MDYHAILQAHPLLFSTLLQGQFGLEKENVRVDAQGRLAMSPHPASLGDKLSHPYITTDFSESQIEMITPALPSLSQAWGFLYTLHDLVSTSLQAGQYLWPQSAPPILPDDEKIPIARYGDDDGAAERYREALAERYGRKVQLISGVHFNFSFNHDWLQLLHRHSGSTLALEDFQNELYLKLARNFFRYQWLLTWLFGHSPAVHASYVKNCVELLPALSSDSRSFWQGTSLRSGVCGYRNRNLPILDFSSLAAYRQSVQALIAAGKISDERELYIPLRIKPLGSKTAAYVEVRNLDLNPLYHAGIDERELHAFHLFLLFCLLDEETRPFGPDEQLRAWANQDAASAQGLAQDLFLRDYDGRELAASEWGLELYRRMEALLAVAVHGHSAYQEALQHIGRLLQNPDERDALNIRKQLESEGFVSFHMQRAEAYLQQSRLKDFNFYGLEDMELSTQLLLRAAVLRGVSFEVLDRPENFVRLRQKEHVEYVQQATKTSLDRYVNILLMENKLLTKQLLHEAGIRVPRGEVYHDHRQALEDFWRHQGRPIVVKPKSTNFGLGISILKQNQSEQHYRRALDLAFEQDRSVLVEEFISGKEYRFFVIGAQVAGILHRVPANVSGDGQSSIRQLVAEKNLDALRGKGYRTPLEKINLGEAEALFLETQNLDFDSVPAEGQTVYLRENSNISTGGDSIDFSDQMHDSYLQIALQAARALGVTITGLDMMIDDIRLPARSDNHAIIELNFNPAIHIHCHPYRGQNRHLNEKILDALGF